MKRSTHVVEWGDVNDHQQGVLNQTQTTKPSQKKTKMIGRFNTPKSKAKWCNGMRGKTLRHQWDVGLYYAWIIELFDQDGQNFAKVLYSTTNKKPENTDDEVYDLEVDELWDDFIQERLVVVENVRREVDFN